MVLSAFFIIFLKNRPLFIPLWHESEHKFLSEEPERGNFARNTRNKSWRVNPKQG